ncbi:tRNA pseudouridine synthase [Quillaja saponaria]|uniref:tRNA pseudouridine synthase n=1 Tax=Quillaja saponaria TaxID=32244 RepID=A0AAD7M118_QUISA|nr:tRNA pseudouridine synthase [Quillaja saponaria]
MSQNPRIQRYLIAIEYIGTRFCGSQKQLNGRTVVGVLEDAGVHAMSNVCHVDVEHISKRKPGEVLQPHEPSVVQKAVNHFLQKNEGDIMVVDVRSVPSDFHARYKAQERIYFYRLLSGPEPLSTFEKDRAWHVAEELSLQAMQEACKALVGCHDFSSFRAAGCQAKSPVRTLDEFNVLEVVPSPYFPLVIERKQNVTVSDDLAHRCSKSEASTLGSFSSDDKVRVMNSGTDLGFGKRKGHRCFVVTARARSFLYHQVRLLVGVLKAVGIGNLTLSDVERILNAKTVTAASPMAPACGLYLGHVKYDLP